MDEFELSVENSNGDDQEVVWSSGKLWACDKLGGGRQHRGGCRSRWGWGQAHLQPPLLGVSHPTTREEDTFAERARAHGRQQGNIEAAGFDMLNYSGAPYLVFKVDLFLSVAI